MIIFKKTARTAAILPVFAVMIIAGGCANQVPADWVAADRATYEAVAPEFTAYVQQDATLTPEQRQRRQNTVETWRVRLEEHEKAVAAGGGQ
jgi:hypothetical protein